MATDDRPVDLTRAEIVRMRETMADRGPDGAGYFERDNVCFAHRRLAIRDLAAGRQPWVSSDGESVLVYNGEIYNDAELREELQRAGYRFLTRCDTEVVMAAWQHWGKECLARLSGMFALGVYDFRKRELFLARDRYGVKPLYVSSAGNSLVFASTIGALLEHPGIPRRPNLRALSHYLSTLRLTLGRETLYEGIWQLLPGEQLVWKGGRIRVERYWDYPESAESCSYDEAVDLLEERLTRAVGERLAGDVPVGLFLSGGVDSNTIATMVREQAGRRLLGCCGGGPHDRSGDFAHARMCAEATGFDFDEVRVSASDYAAGWVELLERTRLPLATPSDVILYRLAARMTRSVGVVLGGEGADELLCGYEVSHWSGHDYDDAERLAGGRWTHGTTAARLFRDSFEAQYRRTRFGSALDHFFAVNGLVPDRAKPWLLSEWAWRAAEQDLTMRGIYEAEFHDNDRSTAERHTRLLHRFNLESLLSRLDRATMSAGLEARVPYTDHRLIETVWALPFEYKLAIASGERTPKLSSAALSQRGTLESKRLLRTLAHRRLAASLAARPKRSFPTPVLEWMRSGWRARIADRLRKSPFGRELFRPIAIEELATDVPRAGMLVWPIVNLIEWGDREFADAA